jgi:hypothetical protein
MLLVAGLFMTAKQLILSCITTGNENIGLKLKVLKKNTDLSEDSTIPKRDLTSVYTMMSLQSLQCHWHLNESNRILPVILVRISIDQQLDHAFQ